MSWFRLKQSWVCCIVVCAALLAADLPALAQQLTQAQVEQWLRNGAVARSTRYPGMGLKLTSPAGYSRSAHFRVQGATRSIRPPHLILDRYLPPVASQGRQGSCGAWSLGYYAYTYAVAKQRKLTREQIETPKFEFSPAFIYNRINAGKDAGITLDKGCDLLHQEGCSTLLEMPYDAGDYTTQPGDAAIQRAARYKAPAYGYLFSRMGAADPERMKTFLAEMQQPFVIGILVFKDFPQGPLSPDFVYDLTLEPTRENFIGGHALTVIGYDDDKHAFRIVNSWGPQWGDNGFIWISEAFLTRYALCGWGFTAGGPIARGGTVTPHVRLEAPNVSRRSVIHRGNP